MIGALEPFVHSYRGAQYRHVGLINHSGTVIAFAMADDAQIVYSVLDLPDAADPSGAIDAIDAHHWLADPVPLPFPDEIEWVEHIEVLDEPAEDEAPKAASTGSTGQLTADAPFQVLTDSRHVYVFRQAGHPAQVEAGSTLLVDRYGLSGTELKLTREVRYRRSRSRTRRADAHDRLGAKDMDGNPFIEPTKELKFVSGFDAGNFAVLLLPTAIEGILRWQIFTAEGDSGTIRSINLERSANGFFDIAGTPLYTSPDPRYAGAVLERLPGKCPFTGNDLVQTTGAESSAMHVDRFELEGREQAQGLAARLYHEQQPLAADPAASPRRGQARVLLCAGTLSQSADVDERPYVAAVDFAVSRTGRLAEVAARPRPADAELVQAVAASEDELLTAGEELAELEEQVAAIGTGDATFYTGASASGFSFTLFLDSDDPDVHARFHTASRPVEGGPQSVEGASGAGAPAEPVEEHATDVENLALGRRTTASSVEPGSDLVSDNAVDGDSGTRWASEQRHDPEWIQIDLGRRVEIDRIVLNWEVAYAKAYEIQVSDDGSTWTSVYRTDSGAGGVEELTGLSGAGRFVRLYGTERATEWGYSLWEFEVYGPVPVESGPDRVRHVELGGPGMLVELYPEPDFAGEPVVLSESGPVPASIDVKSVKVLEAPDAAEQRAAADEEAAAQQQEVERLGNEVEEARKDYEGEHPGRGQGDGPPVVSLPFIESHAPDPDAVLAEIRELQDEQPTVERDIQTITSTIEGLDSQVARQEALRDTAEALRLEVAALRDRIDERPDEQSHRVVLYHDGAEWREVAEGTGLDLSGDRPEIHAVGVDEGLVADFVCKETHWFRDPTFHEWSTKSYTDDLPSSRFERVFARRTAALEMQRAEQRRTLQEQRNELTRKRRELQDAERAPEVIEELEARKAEQLDRLDEKKRRLAEIPEQIRELRSRRFGSAERLALEYHSTDGRGLTIRSGLLGFAWTDHQPALFESALGRLRMYFTGVNEQLFAAYYDVHGAPAAWSLAAQDGPVQLHARSSDGVLDETVVLVGPGSEPALCEVTISNGPAGMREVWRSVPRDAQQFCEVLSGRRKGWVSTVPADRQLDRGSRLVSAATHAHGPVQDGRARLVSRATTPSWVGDSPGTALAFDGESSRLSAADPQTFRHGGDVTVEAWIRPTAVDGEAHVISAQPGDGSAYTLGIRPSTDGRYTVFANVAGTEIDARKALAVDTWHHVAAVFGDPPLVDQPLLYVDGVDVANPPSPRQLQQDDQFTLGASKRDGSYELHFCGDVDEVRIWDAVRSREQLLDSVFTRLQGDTSDLVAYYRVDHADIDDNAELTEVKDSGPRGNDLPIDPSTRPVEVLSTAPISHDTAQVRSALSGIDTGYHDRSLGRPAVTEYADIQRDPDGTVIGVQKRCYAYVRPDEWVLITGYKVGELSLEDVDQAKFDTAANVARAESLLVPMHLKGLFVDRPLQTAGPTVDFTYLPWNDGQRDHNPDYAPLGEHLELPPMQNANGELQAGIHLHWTLPPALCRPIDTEDGPVQPYIPVKWQISRIEIEDDRNARPLGYARTLWSDYLHPASTRITDEHVAIPVPTPSGSKEPPFRYMGVATAGDSPPEPDVRMRDLYGDSAEPRDQPKLTSLGYGDPTFSSYYPNGREILGHHVAKEELGGADTSTWLVSATLYDPNDPRTPLAELMADTGLTLYDILEQLGWATDATGHECIYMFGAVEVEHQPNRHAPVPDSAWDFAIGNTGTEALSAHLANRLAARYGDASKIEEQLEAVLMGNKVHGHAADLSLKFLEARHAQGYQTHAGGTRWRPTGTVAETEGLHGRLAELNKLQEDVDRIGRELSSARRELFADWYKYMLAKYPPPASLEQFDQMRYPTVGAAAAWLESGKNAIDDTQRGLAESTDQLETKLAGFDVTLSQEPADRFYSPTDPVVLISGLDVATLHASAALQPHRADDVFATDARTLLRAADEAWDLDRFVTTGDGWMPFIMEWQAEFAPLVDGSSKAMPENRFTLHEHDVDADPEQVAGLPDPAPVHVQGRTFLSPGARDRLEQSLADFLLISLPGDAEPDEPGGVADEGGKLEARAQSYIDGSRTLTIDDGSHPPSDTDDAVLTACRAYVALRHETGGILSQSLGGFHDALIQRERHLQPNMDDPLGSESEQEFSREIGECVGDEARLAPNPSQPFLPVRAGSLRVTGLRLIDVWGRFEDLLRDRHIEPVYAEPLRPFPFKPGWAGLRPRSVQPLRLRADWLAAGRQPEVTLDEDPLATPILGWVMANHMERSLMCFDADGTAIGAYDREADFATAPGREPGAADGASAMVHLRKHADGDPAWVQAFLDATDDALAQIAPRDHLQHAGMAILAGRPLAVARLRLSFELMGLPAQNQSWALFEEQLRAQQAGDASPRTRWQDMKLPVRLGSYRRLNDGLVGFWVEDSQGAHVGPFHSMASQAWSGEILGHDDPSALLWLPLDGDPVTVTVVVDPRGSVHAATGVLPMRELLLRARDIQRPLQRLSSWYLQAPLLQPAVAGDDAFYAAPPSEPGLVWRWVEARLDLNAEGAAAEPSAWKEYRNFHPMRTKAQLEAPSELREGWLVLEHAPEDPTS